MELKVRLIEYTPNPEKVIASAAKLCYSAVGVDDILEGLDEENIQGFLNKLMSYGHMSPIEHVSFTFAVEGVSRSLTHQLVRHRIASYSQQSQRYVKLNQFNYIVPPEIEKNDKAREIFIEAMEKSQKAYDEIVDILKEKYIDNGMKKLAAEKKAIEDARYVFPNACETKVVITMNARSLMNFFEHRCCNRAQWEIHALADEMLKQVRKVAPILFKNAGPLCVKGNCPEGAMTCGSVKDVREKYS
ncbi:FAD-dependent thymidylate synthase [Clostridium botulinum]|uniref:Flavin-dependent thymidylate synthase n=1 Tax=Clostridium botulinum C/D str. DC5 TaxID=1443128 RepID=A0A0A0IJN1_CLOBO|nr:FAD-dependent thymidylate synthase [Clostridium botulinum]KGN01685.1 FAD-dependent thymidylate synthase [Clostridium botulinum C/D str. DC5]KOC52550.1 FAD-dependent thymidylate synthase [Clostridium botulinum]KOC57928.1 FAD-dependent thymidylate synthase [Clostridium botulinum]MCD3233205.1 FAD-dependent thymidylate synthase [Clostridium botulinum D/C]MCD3238954.1 FAD-dependent thymidylate synthase [Clostridium botulinum D/C]